jgi:hypothetical protein
VEEALALSGRALALLAGLLVVLGVAVYWLEGPKDAAGSPAAARLESLLPSSLEAVSSVELDRGGSEPLRLVRQGTGWRIGAAAEAEADPREVRRFYDAITSVTIRRVLEAGAATLEPYGLQAPGATLRIFGTDAAGPRVLEFGRESPVGDARYARDANGRVLLVDGSVRSALEQDAAALLERRLLPVDPGRVRRLRLDRAGGSLELVREAGEWRLEAPVRDRADATLADQLVRDVLGLSATEFAASRPGAAALRVAVESEGGDPPLVAEIGPTGRDGGPWARRGDGTFACRVEAAAVRGLETEADALRDRRVVLADPDAVRSVRVSGATGTVEFLRGEADAPWRVRDGKAERDAEARDVDDFLDRLHWLRATDLREHDAPVATPLYKVALAGDDGEFGSLELFAGDSAERWLVRSSFRPGLDLTVTREALGDLPASVARTAP